MPLDATYIIEAEQRARRFSGAYTGTSGTLAADVMRLLTERKELLGMIGKTVVSAAWDNADMAKADGEAKWAGPTLIGLAGHIGSGKSAAAAMIPGAHHLQWADPIYRGLAAMFDIPEEVLRDRQAKERRLSVGTVAVSPRDLARTLGTEWGRDVIHPDLWVSLTMRRIERLMEWPRRCVFAICGTRFPNEVAAIRDHGGEVWWIDRPGLEVGVHKSDVALTREGCDRVIVNNGTLDKLRHNVEAAWQDFLASRSAAEAVA